MSNYAFRPTKVPSLAIANSAELFPIRRIYCVGQNYAAHTAEMGGNPERDAPFFFSKPADCIAPNKSEIPYPPVTENFHFEVELVVAIGNGGANISVADANSHIFGYAVGIDFTRRDLQADAKAAGRPWDFAKAADHSAPCGNIHAVSTFGHPSEQRILLKQNGEIRQDSTLADLIWPVPDIVSIASHAVALAPGDLIFTGTPAGVGPVKTGDEVIGSVDGFGEIEVTIVA